MSEERRTLGVASVLGEDCRGRAMAGMSEGSATVKADGSAVPIGVAIGFSSLKSRIIDYWDGWF